jgi:hypothetical protein
MIILQNVAILIYACNVHAFLKDMCELHDSVWRSSRVGKFSSIKKGK